MNAVTQWQQASISTCSYQSKLKIYRHVYPFLKDDGKFLTDYANFVLNSGSKLTIKELNYFINILEIAKGNFLSKEVIETLAFAYLIKNDYYKAIEYFKWLNDFLPYLFEPKIALMQIYLKIGDKKKARQIGIEIMNAVPKIPSTRVSQIKLEAIYLMNKYQLVRSSFLGPCQ